MAAVSRPGPAATASAQPGTATIPAICEGASVSTVRVSGMDVPMCAPCQAARAASKLSRQA